MDAGGYRALFRVLALPLALYQLHSAQAHGIAGNRLFPGTLSFDDPAVADEATLPNFSHLEHPANGADVIDNRINWSFSRLLTQQLAFVIDNSWIHRDWGSLQRSGFDVTSVGIKWEDYRNNLHETLVAASLMWGMGRSGAQGVGANAPDLIKPGIFFGQGFGDLPESLFWLRPLGITGAVVVTHPTGSVSTNFGADPLRGRVGPLPADWVDTVQWGFAIEYNTLYLSKRVGNGLPKEEPLNQFVPLVEFFVRGRAWQANQCNDESWYLLCRNDMAACGRGDSATQSGGWARHRGQDAAPVVS